MVTLVGGKKTKREPIISSGTIPSVIPQKKKEVFTDTEQLMLGKIFDAYEAQYKKKSPFNYQMARSLRQKLKRMKHLKEKETNES